MKRSRNATRLIALILISGASASRCVLADGAVKHRCVTDDDCLGRRRCVDGFCRNGDTGPGGMAGMGMAGIGDGVTGGVSGNSGDAGATGGAGRGGGSGDDGGSRAGSESKGGVSGLGGAAGSGNGGADDGGQGGEGAGSVCPKMVRLPEGFCIDSTEVTRSEYRDWLNTDPQVPTTGLCSSNASYEPDCEWPMATLDRPASCVDWCDANAYCLGAGKRLCGRINGGGAAVDYMTGHDDAGESEWFAACSSGGMHDFPYGDAWSSGQCVDADRSQPPASKPNCQAPAPYDCVFDLSGNVKEWENSCSDDADTAACRLRGGYYDDDMESEFACAADASFSRTGLVVERGIGFRCCSDECP